jgi:hypothetical protein
LASRENLEKSMSSYVASLPGWNVQGVITALYENKNSIIELSNTIDANTAA